MQFTPLACAREVHSGEGPGGSLLLGDLMARRQALVAAYAGKAQCIYLDPPFATGKDFHLRQRIGANGWTDGTPTMRLTAYSDKWPDQEAYLRLMTAAFETAYALLGDDGSLFVHIDARMSAKIRAMLDGIFGDKAFVNEIIWVYQSGGRSMKHFSRKHDTILFYRKTPGAYFNIRAIGIPRAGARRNHMRRDVDEAGRSYRSIVSQGKEYRYYDDDPVFPSDVWDDVSHLQQKDPQRTGFDNQKPLRLLERILLPTTRPGDLVIDLFGGSGTTAVAASLSGRRFLSLDVSPVALAAGRKRLLGQAFTVEAQTGAGTPTLSAIAHTGLGYSQIEVTGYRLEEGVAPDGLSLEPLDALDQLSVGYLRGDAFHAYDSAARSQRQPTLPKTLSLPVLDGIPAALTVDILGRRLLHRMEVDPVGP